MPADKGICCNGWFCLLPSDPPPHIVDLTEVMRMYEGKVFELDKLKQKLEESETSVAKVCSLLIVLF